jgi:membrane-bound inhibitor of C-type lysozyme
VDKVEARAEAERVLAELRGESYDALVQRHLDQSATHEVEAASGARYQIQVRAFWDGGKSGDLRVIVNIDDGKRSAFHPLSTDFIIAPDGSFVGE